MSHVCGCIYKYIERERECYYISMAYEDTVLDIFLLFTHQNNQADNISDTDYGI